MGPSKGLLFMLSCPTQVSLNLTRAVKYGRISMDGGMNSENASILVAQASDLCSRLALACKMLKGITSTAKTPTGV